MLTSFGNAYAYLFGWPALAKINKGIFYMAARGLGLHNYGSPRISGETLAIRNGLLGCSAAPIVFDVGANRGEWLSMVLGIRADSKYF